MAEMEELKECMSDVLLCVPELHLHVLLPAANSPAPAALKSTLESRGVLSQLKAQIRAEIFSSLDASESQADKPVPPRENYLINELLREYLEFNGYRYTLSVLLQEAGQTGERLDRSVVARELRLGETEVSAELPLMYGALAQLQYGPQGVAPGGGGGGGGGSGA